MKRVERKERQSMTQSWNKMTTRKKNTHQYLDWNKINDQWTNSFFSFFRRDWTKTSKYPLPPSLLLSSISYFFSRSSYWQVLWEKFTLKERLEEWRDGYPWREGRIWLMMRERIQSLETNQFPMKSKNEISPFVMNELPFYMTWLTGWNSLGRDLTQNERRIFAFIQYLLQLSKCLIRMRDWTTGRSFHSFHIEKIKFQPQKIVRKSKWLLISLSFLYWITYVSHRVSFDFWDLPIHFSLSLSHSLQPSRFKIVFHFRLEIRYEYYFIFVKYHDSAIPSRTRSKSRISISR